MFTVLEACIRKMKKEKKTENNKFNYLFLLYYYII